MAQLINKTVLGLLIAVLALLFSSCIIHEHHSHTLPLGTTHYVITSDIEWLIWEYCDWDYDLVVKLHSLNYTSDDVCLILFLAYYGHSHPLTIVKWRQKHISWMDITTVHLKLEPSVFFVAIAPEVKLGPPYGKAYGYYRKSQNKTVLTKAQMVSLVHLKVTSQAFDISPIEVMRLKKRGYNFDQIVQNQINTGKEIKTRKGRIIKKRSSQIKKPVKKGQPDKIKDQSRKPKDKPDKSQDKSDKSKQDKSTKDKEKNKDKKKDKSQGKAKGKGKN